MKKTVTKLALLGSVGLLLVTGCTPSSEPGPGGSSSYEPTSEPSSSFSGDPGSKTIKVMFHVDASSKEGIAYKKRIDAFNLAYKDQGLKASPSFVARTAGAADYEQNLIGLQNEGNLPDIITFDAPNCASYANSGLLYDITNLVSSEVKEDYITLNQYNHRLYGLPIQESSAGFYYNKKIFSAAGIDVSGITVDNPWTFDEFKSVCDRLKGHTTFPVDMRLDATQDEMATYLLYPFIYATNGKFLSDDGLTAKGYFNSANTAKGFQFLKDLVTAGYSSYSIGATDFFTGKVGMYLSSGWTIPDLDMKYPEMFPSRDTWGLLPYPKEANAASATGSWCYGVTINGRENKEYVMELLNFLTTAESCKAIVSATGMIAARKSVETNYEPGSPEDVLLQQLSKTGKERPVTIGYPDFSKRFRQVIYGLKDSEVQALLDDKADALQDELDLLNIY